MKDIVLIILKYFWFEGTEAKKICMCVVEQLVLKSVNLQYNMLCRLDDGTNKSSTKRLMFQVLFFFMISSKLYIPSTLNIALLQWHTHLNVCAVK